ncbi:hypothetical protein [Actinophytocola xanthii]|uniref:DUF4367 domain-containing protein n=1 Tax=Actinophytocola xanthii TaxID=1912961 RepID=A0A1Q8BZE4_9PSEU|nr:hypothetical protein [Actinophytocola xanthii]OLF07297.1 hypothetical protein BU204_35730 [Actinophytocola xanthii]OLF07457.1 hypothetical protein BU204_35530 [Actinophytocola xanthii]
MERLFELLREDEPLPPSQVDIYRAVRAGRRRIRIRWAATGAFVLAVALLVPALALPAGPGPFFEPGTRLAIAPEDFDPMRRTVTLTEVPGARADAYTTAARWQQVGVRVGTSGYATVTVYAPGRTATGIVNGEAGLLNPEAGEPADPVGGHRAHWLTLDNGLTLAWQWGDRGWAYLSIQDGEGADRETAHRIAAAVVVHEPRAVAMPFTLPKPDGLHLVGTSTHVELPGAGAAFLRAGVLLAAEDPSDPSREVGMITVSAERSDKTAGHLGADTTLGGRPAMVTPGEVIIFGLPDGFAVEVSSFRDNGQLDEIAQSVRLVAHAGTTSTWVTDPVE